MFEYLDIYLELRYECETLHDVILRLSSHNLLNIEQEN